MSPPRWISARDEFVALALKSGLVAEDDVVPLLKDLDQEAEDGMPFSATLSAFCTRVIALGLLTCWQCEKLRRGQYKSFLIGDYRILDRLLTDDQASRYLAREQASGELVEIDVRFPDADENGLGAPQWEVVRTYSTPQSTT